MVFGKTDEQSFSVEVPAAQMQYKVKESSCSCSRSCHPISHWGASCPKALHRCPLYARQEPVTIMQSKLLIEGELGTSYLCTHTAAHTNAKCAGWYDGTQVAARLLIALIKKKKKKKILKCARRVGATSLCMAVTLVLMQPTEWLS